MFTTVEKAPSHPCHMVSYANCGALPSVFFTSQSAGPTCEGAAGWPSCAGFYPAAATVASICPKARSSPSGSPSFG